MGLLVDRIAFEYPAPGAEEIAAAATKECGLKVCVEDAERDESGECSANFYFEGFPENKVGFHTSMSGTIGEIEKDITRRSGYRSLNPCEGCDDVDGVQRICLRGYLEAENTLLWVLRLAARKLAGCLEEELSVDSDDVEGIEDLDSLTSAIMAERYEKFRIAQKKRIPGYVFFGILTVLATPFWMVWMLICLPFVYFRKRREDMGAFSE